MKLSELVEMTDDGYLFFTVDGVRYEIDEIIDDSDGVILLSGFAE